MLGRTAGGLFWMYRYLERAENTARLIETGQRIALTRAQGSDDEWASVIHTGGGGEAYFAKQKKVTKDAVIDWMLRSPENPSSVLSVFKQARDNARGVRTALTDEVWEAVNGGWMVICEELEGKKIAERDLPRILGRIRQRTALVRGATHGTMLRNDIYDFARIGTFMERADNTGRIIDVKYYVLLPTSFSVGSSLDNVQWETILRALSAIGGYRMVYGQDVQPRQIVEHLVLDGGMPRSLYFCSEKIAGNLGYLAGCYGSESSSLHDARRLAGRLKSDSVETIFEHGLHEYIQSVLSDLARLSLQIEVDYRFMA